jgi:hypothetical protein
MESETPAWLAMLISWAPILLAVGFLIAFTRRGGYWQNQIRYLERRLLFMERQEQLLERIAAALEQRNK